MLQQHTTQALDRPPSNVLETKAEVHDVPPEPPQLEPPSWSFRGSRRHCQMTRSTSNHTCLGIPESEPGDWTTWTKAFAISQPLETRQNSKQIRMRFIHSWTENKADSLDASMTSRAGEEADSTRSFSRSRHQKPDDDGRRRSDRQQEPPSTASPKMPSKT